MGPGVMPMIEQLGLLEKFLEVSKENDVVSNFNEELQLTSTIGYTELAQRNGYPNYIISRPHLYDLFYSQLPKEKIHMNKRVVSIEQEEEGEAGGHVTITFTDKTTARGHILVGADGAYSAVRQSLYDQLHQQDKLPLSDKEEMPCASICLVGKTGPLSTEKFPHLLEKYCRFENVSGANKPYTWLTFCMPDNTICWMVIEHLHLMTNRTDIASNAEWGPGTTDAMIDKVKGFPIPSGAEGLTLADVINETPRELISQVALEGKFFETWYSGRTVLVGDGANIAIQDAIVLSNYLYNMCDSKPATITRAFEGYHQERVASARQNYDTSNRTRHLFRQRLVNGFIRFVFKYIPQMAWNYIFDSFYGDRPQVAFLPLVPDRGKIKAFPQRSLHLNDPPS
ncbi:hypothetical protein BGZ65_006500 [Modicella reniformis]|uniref:FAD-binding domain-containing protein n=1 Tax=Modicella reniformis TaxID=1440133 RepID=A0A9P6IQP8_9FUNG|nr:hypothetical protein BGZ65_006500 [Modicella reniformis]